MQVRQVSGKRSSRRTRILHSQNSIKIVCVWTGFMQCHVAVQDLLTLGPVLKTLGACSLNWDEVTKRSPTSRPQIIVIHIDSDKRRRLLLRACHWSATITKTHHHLPAPSASNQVTPAVIGGTLLNPAAAFFNCHVLSITFSTG